MHRVYRYGNPVFMVELYQYHSVDEPLPVRLLSGQEPVPLYQAAGKKLSEPDFGAYTGPDRHLRGGVPDYVFGAAAERPPGDLPGHQETGGACQEDSGEAIRGNRHPL